MEKLKRGDGEYIWSYFIVYVPEKIIILKYDK